MADKELAGRKAQTRGVSLSPSETELVDSFAELTGVGFTEQVRQTVIRRLPAAVAMLEDMKAAGMEVGRIGMSEAVVYLESDQQRRELYEDSFHPEGAGTLAHSA